VAQFFYFHRYFIEAITTDTDIFASLVAFR